MPSYPADEAVPNRKLACYRGGEKLLKGVRPLGTSREADLCWKIAQFYALALKSNKALGKALEIFASLDTLLEESNLTSDDSARRETRADLRTSRNGLGLLLGKFKRGLSNAVDEFKEEQGERKDLETDINTVEVFKEEQGEGKDSETEINTVEEFKEEQGEDEDVEMEIL